MDAEGPAEVLEFLANKGLRPVSIKSVSLLLQRRKSILGGGLNITDQVFLTKYLALMLRVGTDLFSAIDILIADFDKPSVKALLIEMRANLSKGKPFYVTFANYPKVFSPVFVNMIKAGEVSGNLEKVFEDLSVSLEKEAALRSRIRGALVYPFILMGASIAILTLLISFALPKIAAIFTGGGFKPPVFSRVVFAVGLFFGDNILYIFGGGTILIIGVILLYLRSTPFRKMLYRFFIHLPAVKTVVKKIAIQRFATTLAALLKSGLPILDALEITASAVGNDEVREALMRISREGISKGLTMGEAFKREPIFPRTVANLVSISEKSGHIEEILVTLANFYESEIDASLKTLISLLEPILLMGIGLIIAVIALSIIVPIYQLVGQF